jgi:hypothetical protein
VKLIIGPKCTSPSVLGKMPILKQQGLQCIKCLSTQKLPLAEAQVGIANVPGYQKSIETQTRVNKVEFFGYDISPRFSFT